MDNVLNNNEEQNEVSYKPSYLCFTLFVLLILVMCLMGKFFHFNYNTYGIPGLILACVPLYIGIKLAGFEEGKKKTT